MLSALLVPYGYFCSFAVFKDPSKEIISVAAEEIPISLHLIREFEEELRILIFPAEIGRLEVGPLRQI